MFRAVDFVNAELISLHPFPEKTHHLLIEKFDDPNRPYRLLTSQGWEPEQLLANNRCNTLTFIKRPSGAFGLSCQN